MQAPKQPEAYAVWLMRRDQQHITVLETKSFDEADKLWRELTTQWTHCLKEQIPFELRVPVIIAFDPGLIYEVSLLPFGTPNMTNNPYQQQMKQNGFSNTFNNFAKGEILDPGYKY